MLYEDVGAQPWEPVGGCQRKDVVNGITLWSVGTSANLPLEHTEQTLFILNGSGKLQLGELVFIASPGIVIVLPQSDKAVVMAYPGDPLTILQVAVAPRTPVQRKEEKAAEYESGAQPPLTAAKREFVLDVETIGGTDRIPEVTGEAIFEPAPAATPSTPLPPDPAPREPASPVEHPISPEMPSAPGASPLARYLASSPISSHTRHPVSRATRE